MPMDLVLWRHAEAEEGADDLARELTAKGRKQAQRMARWLEPRLPARYTLLASPAARAQQTAMALRSKVKTLDALAPGAKANAILKAAGWPKARGTVIVVGHQPDLGLALSQALLGTARAWKLKKGAVCWLGRNAGEDPEVFIRALIAPDLL